MKVDPILISGGDGFIGKNIVKKLSEMGYPVIVIDNHITSFPSDSVDPLVKVIDIDISTLNIEDVPKVSGIIHLASVAAPLVYKDNPSLVIDPNTLGTRKLISLAQRDKARILFASTSEVYGHISDEKIIDRGIKENDNACVTLLSERSCYSAAKRFGEELILNYIKQGGDAANFRLFNVYGNNMDSKHIGYGRVIPNFFNKIQNNEAITIFGSGNQVRSFLWIDDAVSAILELMFYKGILPDAINIGKADAISILDLAKKISSVLNKELMIEHSVIDCDDPLWRKPNIDLISDLISWIPKVSLQDGLLNIMEERSYK
ncbi:MAG: NAD-dependent epimerase/dehydratase family protein [Marinifilaceae bacterium]